MQHQYQADAAGLGTLSQAGQLGQLVLGQAVVVLGLLDLDEAMAAGMAGGVGPAEELEVGGGGLDDPAGGLGIDEPVVLAVGAGAFPEVEELLNGFLSLDTPVSKPAGGLEGQGGHSRYPFHSTPAWRNISCVLLRSAAQRSANSAVGSIDTTRTMPAWISLAAQRAHGGWVT